MVKGVYPVLMSEDIEKGARFFIDIFEFEETYTSDWYISLRHESGHELALIDRRHDTIPDTFKDCCKGMILNFEIDDINDFYATVTQMPDVPILTELKDEEFGQRHFMIESPDQILVDIIQIIPPTDEYSANYTGTDNGDGYQ